MKTRFQDRREAGIRLAAELDRYQGRADAVVVALPRGGVPVAAELALRLQVPLDIMIVRKLGTPGEEELALGAIATGGFHVMNADVVQKNGIDEATVNGIVARELKELQRREATYRKVLSAQELKNKTVILVDDGIATGATVRVAIQAARASGAARVIVAAPVASSSTARELENEADEVITLLSPWNLSSIGEWYEDFTQLSEEETCDSLYLLARSRQPA